MLCIVSNSKISMLVSSITAQWEGLLRRCHLRCPTPRCPTMGEKLFFFITLLTIHQAYSKYTKYAQCTPSILTVHQVCSLYTKYTYCTLSILHVHNVYLKYRDYTLCTLSEVMKICVSPIVGHLGCRTSVIWCVGQVGKVMSFPRWRTSRVGHVGCFH